MWKSNLTGHVFHVNLLHLHTRFSQRDSMRTLRYTKVWVHIHVCTLLIFAPHPLNLTEFVFVDLTAWRNTSNSTVEIHGATRTSWIGWHPEDQRIGGLIASDMDMRSIADQNISVCQNGICVEVTTLYTDKMICRWVILTFGAFQTLCKTSIALWSKFLQEISHLSPLFQKQKYLSACNRPRFILKKNDFWTPKNYFENEHPHLFSIGSSTAASPTPRRIPAALGFHLRNHPHIWIYIGAEQCGRIYRFTFFSSGKMWCRRKSSVSANFCHCTAFLPHSNTQIHHAATRARASARPQISILAKHACATVVRANDITPPTPPRTTPLRPTQQQKCAKSVNV